MSVFAFLVFLGTASSFFSTSNFGASSFFSSSTFCVSDSGTDSYTTFGFSSFVLFSFFTFFFIGAFFFNLGSFFIYSLSYVSALLPLFSIISNYFSAIFALAASSASSADLYTTPTLTGVLASSISLSFSSSFFYSSYL
jgi:hypothetical protein